MMDNENKNLENTLPEQEEKAPQEAPAAEPALPGEDEAEAVRRRLAQKRRLRYGAFAALITVGVIVITVVLNVLVSLLTDRYPLSLDLTSTGMYDISDESKEYVKNLTQDVKITILAQQSSLTGGSEYMAQVAKTIEAYAQNSPRVTVGYLDLTANPAFASQYPDYDLASYDVIVESGGRVKVESMNEMLNYNTDSYYTTGSYTIESSTAEQKMTNAIMYVTSGEATQVQFITGLGETDSADLQKLLTSNSCEVSSINLLSEEPSAQAAALVWFGPTKDPTEDQLKKLDKYLAGGGNLFVFTDPQVNGLTTLDAFLAEWGLGQEAGVAFETNQNFVLNMNPYLPIVQYTSADYAGSLAGSNKYTAFYSMKPVYALFETSGYVTTTTLLSLSETSGWHSTEVSSDYQIQQSDIVGNVGAMVLASSYDGSVTSNVVLTGTTASFSGEFLTNTAVSNAEYFVGVFNKLCDRGDLVTIAAKDFSSQTNNMTTAQINTAIVVFMAVIPLAVLAAGIYVWVRRRHR